MFPGRMSRLLWNSFYLFIAASAITYIVVGLLFTAIKLGLLFTAIALGIIRFYHIPAVPNETVASRLKQMTREDDGRDDNRNIILHRGGIFDLPENTLEAVKLAREHGAGAVEIDLEFTEDGVGVLLHDGTVDRTTDGCGHISKMKFDCVRKLDAAAKHECRSKTGPLQVPSLEECVTECLKLDLMMYIDCKSQPQKTAELLAGIFKKHPDLYNKAVVCSFYPTVIYAVRKKDPAIITGLTHRHNVLSANMDGTPRNKEMWKRVVSPILDYLVKWAHYSLLWFLCGNSFFLIHKDDISRNVCKYWSSLGIQVIPWTVNDPKEKEFFRHSLKCPIITDGMTSN